MCWLKQKGKTQTCRCQCHCSELWPVIIPIILINDRCVTFKALVTNQLQVLLPQGLSTCGTVLYLHVQFILSR